ncbi:MAG: hypothetical protein LBT89_12180 [Planctomycetaceae bacterium]|jgi:hypothetical protein|nr:hypothetical protein [Planctomycetaceae bacterium]
MNSVIRYLFQVFCVLTGTLTVGYLIPTLTAADVEQTLLTMSFESSANDWRVERSGKAALQDKALHITAAGGQPMITKFFEQIGGEFHLFIEIRTFTESSAFLYWTSRGSPRRHEQNKVTVPLQEDGDWHTYEFVFNVSDYLSVLALGFSKNDGNWAIRSMKLVRKSPPPFTIQKIEPFKHKAEGGTLSDMLRFTVHNDIAVPLKYRINHQPEELTLDKNTSVDLGAAIDYSEGNLAAVVLTLHPQDFPDITRSVFLYRSEGKTDWIRREFSRGKVIEVDSKGKMARLLYNNQPVAIIAPLVHRNGIIPNFIPAEDSSEKLLHFVSEDTDLRIEIGEPLRFIAAEKNRTVNPEGGSDADRVPLEAVAVRLFGKLRSGLLPGVEFLGRGDVSSSPIDIAPPLNDRSVPERRWITNTLAILETEKAGVIMRWKDRNLQPTFSSPNTFDQTDDHRMSLIGSRIEATLELLMPDTGNNTAEPEEESAVMRTLKADVLTYGFAEPPAAPRTTSEQFQLSLQALAGLLQTDNGGEWGYAVESQWQRKPFADFLSTLIRLNELNEFRDLTFPGLSNPKSITQGGSDITNDTVYFVTNRAAEWQRERETAIQQLLTMQQPDGSFLYRTRFPEAENTVSSFGFTALQALKIMEYVRLTGNAALYTPVKQTLMYLRHCEIPSGGFYRDTPFHTPDLQAAAAMIWLHIWAYEYDGNADYLQRAQYFAYAGLPFVYQWQGEKGKQNASPAADSAYFVIPKFGGTNRGKPFSFGIADMRTAIQYAYALNLLSKYDTKTDWKKVSWGILYRIEQIQWTQNEAAGCIPVSYDVVENKPLGFKVNPCAFVSLSLVLEGKPESLYLLVDGKDRYVSPYPLHKNKSIISASGVPPKRKFQVLLNGSRLGRGKDTGEIDVD